MSDEEQGTPIAHSPSKEKPLRFSLAGVQLKFSARLARKRLTIPLEGSGGSWIVKLPTNAFARLPENEFAMMRFARACGLNVPDLSLVQLDEIAGLPHALPNLREDEPRKAYAIARFDRKADGERTHVEDFNQIAGQAPAQKYESRNYEWIGNVVQTLCPPEDADEFVARLIFGIGIGNNDMHLKNWALTYPDGRNARLAPMYDFVCTGAYYANQELALPLAGEKRFSRMTLERLRIFANAARLSARRVTTVAKETAERMRAEWTLMKDAVDDRNVRRAVEGHFEKVPLMKTE
jgi:serine/threonine-protein kinase HipA